MSRALVREVSGIEQLAGVPLRGFLPFGAGMRRAGPIGMRAALFTLMLVAAVTGRAAIEDGYVARPFESRSARRAQLKALSRNLRRWFSV